MTDNFTSVPAGWPDAGAYFPEARERTFEALNDEGVVDRVAAYYATDGNYAGSTFLEVGPYDPYSFVEGDLLALTLLEVSVPPQSVRRFLAPSATRQELTSLLAEDKVPLDADLRFADAAMLENMEALYTRVKQAASPADESSANWWVTASKLCARKRPELFPVRDGVVCTYLGLLKAGGYQIDWQVFRHLIQSDEVRATLDDVLAQAAERPGVHIGRDNNRLRHLDVVLWMHARRLVRARS